MGGKAYVINKGSVVSEFLDNELTVINLEKGFYFIGRGPAIDLFLMLEEPRTEDAMVARTLGTFAVEEGIAREEIAKLLEQWAENELITETGAAGEEPVPDDGSDAKPWSEPVFMAFDDMRDLLLIDPIHDTQLDEQGWPVAAGDASSDS